MPKIFTLTKFSLFVGFAVCAAMLVATMGFGLRPVLYFRIASLVHIAGLVVLTSIGLMILAAIMATLLPDRDRLKYNILRPIIACSLMLLICTVSGLLSIYSSPPYHAFSSMIVGGFAGAIVAIVGVGYKILGISDYEGYK